MSERNAWLLKELQDEQEALENALEEEVGVHQMTCERERYHQQSAAKLKANPQAARQEVYMAKATAAKTMAAVAEKVVAADAEDPAAMRSPGKADPRAPYREEDCNDPPSGTGGNVGLGTEYSPPAFSADPVANAAKKATSRQEIAPALLLAAGVAALAAAWYMLTSQVAPQI